MADQPKFFRVAVEGDTTDGRKLTRQDILDCAETFNSELYGIRVNLEHYRGIVPDGVFDMLGDVTAVKAEQIDLPVGSTTQKVMALFAQIKPLERLIAFNKKRQKIFSSIEIGQNCRGTGKAFLMGLAVTDSPASFGTQALEFAAQNPAFLASRKSAEDSLFCVAHEIPSEVFAIEEAPADPTTGLFAKISAFVDSLCGKPEEKPAPVITPPAAEPADGAAFTQIGTMMTEMAGTLQGFIKSSGERHTALETQVKSFADLLEKTPANQFQNRAPATGGNGNAIKTDC